MQRRSASLLFVLICRIVLPAWQPVNPHRIQENLTGRGNEIESKKRSVRAIRNGNTSTLLSPAKEFIMSKEQENKIIVGRWFKEFCGNPWNPKIVDELGAPDMLLQYSLHAPRRGHEDVKAFMSGFRRAFPDLSFAGAADLIAEGDYVVGRWVGGGTHTGPGFSDFLIGSLPAASGRKMRFTSRDVHERFLNFLWKLKFRKPLGGVQVVFTALIYYPNIPIFGCVFVWDHAVDLVQFQRRWIARVFHAHREMRRR